MKSPRLFLRRKNALLLVRVTKLLFYLIIYDVPEIVELLKLFLNWKMLLIFPAAWVSNFFYTYQFNHVNKDQFNLRTRGLNNVLYWGCAQMLGSVAVGYLLDFSFQSRRMRGFVGIGVVGLRGTAIWGGGLVNELRDVKHGKDEALKFDSKDTSSNFAGPFDLYFGYGLLDAMFQSLVYWVIGALADDSEILSRCLHRGYCLYMVGYLGSLSSISATKLGSLAAQCALKRANVDPSLVQLSTKYVLLG